MALQQFITSIRPHGWLERQLRLQAEGLAGQLDRVWPDVRDSRWIGGSREGWERVPYWLDGFIPLAWLLNDPDMKARAKRYLNAIMDAQEEDGWICPCEKEKRARYDLWALLLISKVLTVYCEMENDSRAENALYRAMKNGYELLRDGTLRLFDWGRFRWFEGLVAIRHLMDRGTEEWMTELAYILKEQGTDYLSLTDRWERALNQWTYETHIVNIAMAFKYEALWCAVSGEKYTDRAETLWRFLQTRHGTAVGTLTGDECLSGPGNIQGTELCAVVEMMYSCEKLLEFTGAPKWADRLEKIAYNALPAAVTDDMWAHQYDQQVNQIACVRFPGKSIFRTNGPDAHLFGLEVHYGCCTANHGQGWPKLAQSTFIRTRKGLYCPLMLPAEAGFDWGRAHVTVRMDTDYPFRTGCVYTVSTDRPIHFTLSLRIPGGAKNISVDTGHSVRGNIVHIAKLWDGKTRIRVGFDFEPYFTRRPKGLFTAQWGPMVFALPIDFEAQRLEYEKDGVERKYPYCDYELYPKSGWNYGFASEELEMQTGPVGPVPFAAGEAPVGLRASLAPVNWPPADGYETVAAPAPASHIAQGTPKDCLLIPYGCTRLRMTEMPRVKQKKT